MKLVVFWIFTAVKRTLIEGQDKRDSLVSQPRFSAFGVQFVLAASFLFFLVLSSGCGNKFFDPSQVGRFRPIPAVNVILDSLGVAEETQVAWEGAEEPQPIDTVVTESDYVFRPDDVVSIAIFELLQEGVHYVNNFVITETGKISIPEVGVVTVAGLSETQLEEEIKKILSPSILKDPSVSVTLIRSQQRMFSILGDGVPLPGRYPVPRYDYRLTDALATAGGPRQFNVSFIYVSRFVGDKGQAPNYINPGFIELELKVIQPRTTKQDPQSRETVPAQKQYQWPQSKVIISSSEMTTDTESARFPSAYGQLNNRTSNRMYSKDTLNSSNWPAVSRTMEEQESVEDILKRFSEQSGSGQNRRADVPSTYKPFSEPINRQRQGRMNLGQDLKSTLPPANPGMANGQINQNNNGHIEWVFKDGQWVPVPVETPKETAKPTGQIEWVFKDGQWVPIPIETSTLPQEEPEGHIEWVFKDGKWVPVQVGRPKTIEPVVRVKPDAQLAAPPEEKAPVFGLEQVDINTRLIKIPTDRLLAGDPRYNVVIKPGDSIFVPVDIVGEFCIMGNVNRSGYIPITGRPMTLKQAIAAAGGLGPLAWPKRCEVVRRIGRKKEEIVMVDLDKIASGEQPDFFIKPHDLINVGTHATARWRAILRNAFRATYGFGFVYDRNFADRDFGTRRPIPNWF